MLTWPPLAADTPPDYLDLVDRKHPRLAAGGMIGFLSRFVGLWLIAGALVALVIDASRTIAASALVITPLGRAWADFSQASYMSAREFVEQKIETYAGHWVWDPVINLWILHLPTWAVLGLAGFLLTWLGRKRRLRTAYG